MRARKRSKELDLLNVGTGRLQRGVEPVRLETNEGVIDCRFHPTERGDAAVVWVGGAVGGLDGPAGGLYPRLASKLAPEGIASLRLDYRFSNELDDCVLDTLMG